MSHPEEDIFRRLTGEERWRRYCGFLELSPREFLQIQATLLAEQLERIHHSLLGRMLLGTNPPRCLDEFRRRAPFTTYEDYEPYLRERDESAVAARPEVWCRCSPAKSRKWIPHSREAMDRAVRNLVGACMLARGGRRTDRLSPSRQRILAALPPAPSVGGLLLEHFRNRLAPKALHVLPAEEEYAAAPLLSRPRGRLDVLLGTGPALLALAAGRSPRSGDTCCTWRLLGRLRELRGTTHGARTSDRPTPREALIVLSDAPAVARKEIGGRWGVQPLAVYLSCESLIAGMQAWNRRSITLVPDAVFFEFLPLEGRPQSPESRSRGTVLLDQVEPGALYELVVTQFYGMPLLRYRSGGVLRAVSAEDEESGVRLPQWEIENLSQGGEAEGRR